MKWRWHMAQSLGGKLWGVQNGKVQCFVCFNTRKRIVAVEKEKWITRVSIPLPIACKAIALPFELVTLTETLNAYPHQHIESHTSFQTQIHWLHHSKRSASMSTCAGCFLRGCYPCQAQEGVPLSKPILLGCEDPSCAATRAPHP